MSIAVLISIQPKWCELIARRIKTIEVRKTRPMLETPFKCYIYCTKNKPTIICKPSQRFGNGKAIGEFVCDQIEEIAVARRGGDGPLTARGGNEVWNGGMVEHMSCLSTEDVCRYVGGVGGVGYGWHISNLKIYDQPRKLSEFSRPCPESLYCESCAMWSEQRGCGNAALQIKRPPQSWCYVREVNS